MNTVEELYTKFNSCLPNKKDRNPAECWPWFGGVSTDGYGVIWWNNKQWRAHVISYTLYKGEIPKGSVVRHTCDNPCCVNPNHLLLGTQADNIQDALKRGRLPNHKLNEEAVKVIRWMLIYAYEHKLDSKLASLYKVNRKAIYKIKSWQTWKHVIV